MKKALLSKPVEWADTVGDKLGRFLPSKKNKAALPRKSSVPNLEQYAADADDDVRIKGHASDDGDGRGSPDPSQGPDTSSLTAFLYNLLSYTDKSGQGGDDKVARPSSRSGNESPDRQCMSGETEDESSVQRGEFYDVDWLLVDEHVKVSSSSSSQPVNFPSRLPKKQLQSIPIDRLPSMSDQSCLLSDNLRSWIHPALPTLAKGRQWVLLYSTEKHGMSLLTLYRNSNMLTGPCLLVAGDKEGAVFGGLATAPLLPTPKKKYQGTSDSFVFSNITGRATIFHSTGLNRYFVLATADALAFGGGSHFALHLDAELLNGSSGDCETYGNPCLAHSEEFVLKHVELWGFDHTQRHSSFKDSEGPPSLMSC